MYGVTATVELNMKNRRANVQLRGVPVGGRLSGTGWLDDADSEAGGVVLEPEFSERLSKRFVSVQSAALNRTVTDFF